jgi:hypothetical protein
MEAVMSDETTSIVRPTGLMRFRFCGREAEQDGLPAVGREAIPSTIPTIRRDRSSCFCRVP